MLGYARRFALHADPGAVFGLGLLFRDLDSPIASDRKRTRAGTMMVNASVVSGPAGGAEYPAFQITEGNTALENDSGKLFASSSLVDERRQRRTEPLRSERSESIELAADPLLV